MSIRILIRILSVLIFGGLLSCGHFQRPEYTRQGEYSTPEEFMSDRYTSRPSKTPARGPFRLRWPVANFDMSRGFRETGKGEHHGLDIRGRKNDPILAAHDGVVIFAGTGFRGYGKMIIIEYDGNWATLYAHLNAFKVKTADEVKAGDLIGLMGRTGRATGVHLHFELLKNKIPIDPLPIFERHGVTSGRRAEIKNSQTQ